MTKNTIRFSFKQNMKHSLAPLKHISENNTDNEKGVLSVSGIVKEALLYSMYSWRKNENPTLHKDFANGCSRTMPCIVCIVCRAGPESPTQRGINLVVKPVVIKQSFKKRKEWKK